MSKAVAIILARGGSKGLPRKNVLKVAGKPCIAWTIEHARRSTTISEVAVSSDDAEILEVAQQMGVRSVARPSALADDKATVDAAARHAVGVLEQDLRGLREPGCAVVLLYGNVPVRPADLTDRAVAMLMREGADGSRADSVQSYARVGKYHPWWMVRLEEGCGAIGRIRPWEGEVLNHNVFRRQDLPPAYIPDGGVLCCTREALMLELAGQQDGSISGPHAFLGRPEQRRGIVSGERGDEVVDIDSRVDLLVAEAILGG